MGLHLLTTEQLRTAARQRLESLELWLRRLVHEECQAAYGPDYVANATLSSNAVFNAQIRKYVADRMKSLPVGIRPVDAMLLDHLATVLCKDDAYQRHFSKAFAKGFPAGKEHLRLMLQRLVVIRNALSHANAISDHDAERALCYSSDIIASLVQYYGDIGMSRDYDAPVFTRYSDSLGNVEIPGGTDKQLNFTAKQSLRCGESLRIEVEVDAHYGPDTYDIAWLVTGVPNGESGVGNVFAVALTPKHVNEHFCIFVTLVSRGREWHRHGTHDARLVLVYRVLPPV